MSETELIRQAVLDYFEGWYDADATRMDRALHPGLVKRSPHARDPVEPELGMLSKDDMLEQTRAGHGAEDAGDRRVDITVADVHDGIAAVVVRTQVYREYLHLVRGTDAGWRIAHALWVLDAG